MANYDAKTKEAIRNAYITSRTAITEIAKTFNVAPATAIRWRTEAKKEADDWDILREHFFLIGNGMEGITRQMLTEYILQHKQALEELKIDETLSTHTKVELLSKLSQSLAKTVDASRHILPKTDRLATAFDVMKQFVHFIQQDYPQHTPELLEILEPFGKRLIKEYSQ